VGPVLRQTALEAFTFTRFCGEPDSTSPENALDCRQIGFFAFGPQ
jgi:hypothetical protein